jgi:hypothetical protein
MVTEHSERAQTPGEGRFRNRRKVVKRGNAFVVDSFFGSDIDIGRNTSDC